MHRTTDEMECGIKTCRISLILAAVVGLAVLVACARVDADVVNETVADAPVSFSMYVRQVADSRAGLTGEAGISTVKTSGFGVFAYYTGTSSYVSSDDSDKKPNFMYNQRVTYEALEGTWNYAPVKYWPNDFSTDAVDDTGATGSADGGKVSFFAYAPYVYVTTTAGEGLNLGKEQQAKDPADAGYEKNMSQEGTTGVGITALTPNNQTGDPGVTYTLTSSLPPLQKDNVDLLWGVRAADVHYSLANGTTDDTRAYNTDLTKQTVTETVDFLFKHALARLKLVVLGAFDELTPGEKNVEADTRILVNSITVNHGGTINTPLTARLDLYNPAGANKANWLYVNATPSTIDILHNSTLIREGDPVSLMNTTIKNGRYNGKSIAEDYSAWTSLTTKSAREDTFINLPEGVTHTEKNVLNLPLKQVYNEDTEKYEYVSDDTNYDFLMIPAKINGTKLETLKSLDITISYDVITHDEALVRNTPAGFSIIRNNIKRTITLPGDYSFDANKVYTIRMVLGMTTVKFDVIAVDEWLTPVLLTPIVKEWETETHEYNVE